MPNTLVKPRMKLGLEMGNGLTALSAKTFSAEGAKVRDFVVNAAMRFAMASMALISIKMAENQSVQFASML